MVPGRSTRSVFPRDKVAAARPIADAIEAWLRSAGKTKADLARAAGITGNWLQLIMTGDRPVGPDLVEPLADALGIRDADARERWSDLCLLTRCPTEVRERFLELRAEVERLRGRRRKRG